MATKRASENLFPVVRLLYEDDTPATPPAGQGQLVAGVDKVLRWIDDDGVLTELGASTGIAATIVDAAGDLIVASAADTVARLPVGADGDVLTADSGEALGVAWATPAGATDEIVGWSMPTLYSPFALLGVAPTTADALATSGGSIAIPFVVAAPMKLHAYKLRNTDTAANLRTAESRLYRLNAAASQLDFVTGTDAAWSFTPAGSAADRQVSIATAPTTLDPGVYWLALRNTSATQTFGIGYGAFAGTFFNQQSAYLSQTLGSALGSTLTLAGWSGGARSYGIVLIGNTSFGT
jgi:hypothetical protein